MTNGDNRLRRWAPYAVAVILLTVAIIGNLASRFGYRAPVGSLFVPLLDEISSGLVWLALLPVIVCAFKTFVPPRAPWPATPFLHVGTAALVSLVHYGATRLLRAIVYAGLGQGFQVPLAWGGYVADLYRDVLNYLLFGLVGWGVELLMAPRAKPSGGDPEPVLEVRDGPQTFYLPIAELLWVEAAGNYVELHAVGGRTILMRATLASLAQRLEGHGFLRVHRSRLVSAAAVSAVENQPAGDAILVLADSARISASRRYRSDLAKTLGERVLPSR